MKANFTQVMGWIGLSEGGYVNHPNDPGGPTDRGITQATFDAWNRRHGYPRRTVKGISRETAEAILASQYFAPVRFDDLPPGLDYAVVDWAVNSGVHRAAVELQRLIGATPDGIIAEHTLAALVGQDIPGLIIAYCNRRMAFLRSLRTWKTFGKGWRLRVMGAQDGPQDSDIGVIDRAVRLSRNADNIPAPVTAAPGKATAAPGWFSALLALLIGRMVR